MASRVAAAAMVYIAGCIEGDTWKFTTFWYGDPNAEEMDVRLDRERPDLSCAFQTGHLEYKKGETHVR